MIPARFDFMNDIQRQIKPELKSLLNIYHTKYPPCSKADNLIFKTLGKRLEGISVRSSFVVLVYKYFEGISRKKEYPFRKINEHDLRKIAFITDAAMTVMYMHNHIYDMKNDTDSHDKINNTLSGVNLLKDLIYEYTDKNRFPGYWKRVIFNQLRDAYSDVEHGQVLGRSYSFKQFIENEEPCEFVKSAKDDKLLLISGLIEELKKEHPSVNNFFEIYFLRIYLLNSSFLKALVEILASIAKFKGEEEKLKVIAFSEVYGIMLQVINDNSDFVLDAGTNGKKRKDVLCDLKNNTVTLPMMFHMQSANGGLIHKYIQSKSLNPKENINPIIHEKHNDVLKEIVSSGAMEKSMAVGKELASIANTFFKPATNRNEDADTKLLGNLTSLAYWNRFYYHIKKAKVYYKQGREYRCEEHIKELEKQAV